MSTECETRAKFEADARLAGYSNFNRERGRYCHVELEVFYQGYLMGGRQVSAAQSAPAGVSEGWKLVPVEPTEEMWSGLARHLMMWLDFGNPTVEALRKHLDMLNIEWPAWMNAESELRGSGVPSKGTRATLIYKAMLYAAPAQPAAQCTNEDSWNCKYCRKTATCDALKDERNFQGVSKPAARKVYGCPRCGTGMEVDESAKPAAHDQGEVQRLREAAQKVISHVEGDLPIKGWLRDNDASRKALGDLRACLAASTGQEVKL